MVVAAVGAEESIGGGEAVAGNASPLATDREPWRRPKDRRHDRWFAKVTDHEVRGHIGSGGDGGGCGGDEADGAAEEEVESESEHDADEGEDADEDEHVGPLPRAMNETEDNLSSRNLAREGHHWKYQHWTWLAQIFTGLDTEGKKISGWR